MSCEFSSQRDEPALGALGLEGLELYEIERCGARMEPISQAGSKFGFRLHPACGLGVSQ